MTLVGDNGQRGAEQQQEAEEGLEQLVGTAVTFVLLVQLVRWQVGWCKFGWQVGTYLNACEKVVKCVVIIRNWAVHITPAYYQVAAFH